MKIQVTFTLDLPDGTPQEDVDTMVYSAQVQFEEPQDSEGDRAAFETSNVVSDWFPVSFS